MNLLHSYVIDLDFTAHFGVHEQPLSPERAVLPLSHWLGKDQIFIFVTLLYRTNLNTKVMARSSKLLSDYLYTLMLNF